MFVVLLDEWLRTQLDLLTQPMQLYFDVVYFTLVQILKQVDV
jgi:hypothetical protein